MLSIQARQSIVLNDGSSVVRVTSARTFYQVAVDHISVTVIGPGVKETYEIGGEGSPVPNDPDLSDEGKAALAVIYFEESNQ